MNIRDYLKENVLVFDGGMGTYFASKNSGPFDRCEVANITKPQQIYDIHTEYINAGCKAIKTNTFAANIDNFDGDSEYLKKVITEGWKVAERAAEGKDIFVFADIGPVSESDGVKTSEKYIETADIFINLGAKNFLFETLYDDYGIYETAEHIKKKVPDAFIIVSFSVQIDGYTKDGVLGTNLIKRANESEYVDYTGLNCVLGPHHMYKYFKKIADMGANFSVMPNAGYPTVINNRTFFGNSPSYFAIKIKDMVKKGAKIVGGCCGTTPEYIKNIVHELSSEEEDDYLDSSSDEEKTETTEKRVNTFAEKLNNGKKVIAVELDPPTNADITKFEKNAKILKEKGIDIITIADCPVAKARADSSILACRVKRELGMDALPHITCRDRNINATKALLLGLNIEGINNVLIVTGDPVPSAMRDEVKSVFNFNSRMLIKYISNLNETVFENKFMICAALNVNALNFDIQLRMAREKEANGVSVFLTQPVMTEKGYENLKKAKQELKSKILAGIMPVVSYRNACFMDSEIPGIAVAEEIKQLFKGKSKEESAEIGIKVAADIAVKVKDCCDGYYLITPFNRADIICSIIDKIRE